MLGGAADGVDGFMSDDAVRIRLGGQEDVGVLAALHRSTVLYAYAGIFPPDAPAPELESLIEDWAARIGPGCPVTQACFVAEAHDAIVGVVVAGPDPRAAAGGFLSRLHVDPSRWGTGIGRLLHQHAIAHLRAKEFRRATLWVLEGNVRARRFYEQLGWIPNGRRLTMYAPGGVDDVGYDLAL